jgi:sugar phosphate isomerase/epimerase
MLTLALSSWSLHRHLPYYGSGAWSPARSGEEIAITAFPAVAQSFGIASLEICQMHLATSDPSYIAQLRDAVRAAGCHVINVPIDVGNLSQADPGARAVDLRLIERWIDAAQALGAPAVRVNMGHAGDRPESEAFAAVVEGFRALAAYCADRRMTLLLENHWGLSATPSTILALLDAVEAPNLRLCPDFGNFAPDMRLEGLRLMLPRAAAVHAKVLDVDQEGDHIGFEFGQCCDLLRESGYAGLLSIEFEGKGDQRQGIAAGKRLIERYLGDLLDRPN